MASPAFAPVIVEENNEQYSNVISFNAARDILDAKKVKPVSPKARPYNGGGAVVGKSSEVYPFRTKEEVKAMIDVFDNHIMEATDEHHRQLASRNKLLFIIGINVGLRASDLVTLKWNFFLNGVSNGEYDFKEFYTLQPKKTRKQKKFVKMFFNNTVKKAVTEYLNEFPTENLDSYLFESREGDESITTKTLWRIIKNAAKEAGLSDNYGSHSLRKTFGFWIWHNADDKDKSLVILNQIFNHSSIMTTRKYIGIMDDEIKDAFESIELGFDFL